MELTDIVLETDCPYLTPVPHRGERNESSYVKYICQKVAELKGVDYSTVAEQTTENVIEDMVIETQVNNLTNENDVYLKTILKGSGRVYTTDEVDTLFDNNVISKLGANNGIAQLNNDGQVPSYQLPSYIGNIGTFTELSQGINDANDILVLTNDFVNTDTDTDVIIDKDIIIDGSNYEINLNNVEGVNFKVNGTGLNIIFRDCVFTNCYGTCLFEGTNISLTFINCIFKSNSVSQTLFKLTSRDGYVLKLYDCEFVENTVRGNDDLIHIAINDSRIIDIKKCKFRGNIINTNRFLISLFDSSGTSVEDCFVFDTDGWRRIYSRDCDVPTSYTEDSYEKITNKTNTITDTSTNTEYPSAKAVYDEIYSTKNVTGSFDELYDLAMDFYDNGVDDTTIMLRKDYIFNSGEENIIVFGGHTLAIKGNNHTIKRPTDIDTQLSFVGFGSGNVEKIIKIYDVIFLNGFSQVTSITAKNTEFYNCTFINQKTIPNSNTIPFMEAENCKFINCTFISCDKGIDIDSHTVMINCIFNGNNVAVEGVDGSKIIDCIFITNTDTVIGATERNSITYTKNEIDELIGDINDYIIN